MESFNEFMFMCFIYHLFVFSNWTLPKERLPYGFVYLGCMVIMIVVNIVTVILNTVEKAKAKKRRERLIEIGQQRIEIHRLAGVIKKL